ncbi:MAG: metallophosphoesterase [Thermodesulfobacteriota bacterium]
MISRRDFIKGGLAAGAAALTANAFWFERENLTLEKVAVSVKGLPLEFDGFNICQITDVHHGPFISLEYVESVVKAANELSADAVVLTGDYVTDEAGYIAPVVKALSGIKSKYGIFAVLGNHDHRTDANKVSDELKNKGIRLLRNEGTHIDISGARICMAGVGDLMEDRPDAAKALSGADALTPRILLSHNPDYAGYMPKDMRVDLMISGHTHGGQVRVPFTGYAPYMPSRNGQKFTGGLVDLGHTRVYVSRGVGVVGLPVRVNCPPEITLITLERDGARDPGA